MALEPSSLLNLDAGTVRAKLLQAAQLLAEQWPELDFKAGVIRDLVLRPHAALAAAQQETIDRLRRSWSLAAILADPSLASDEVVDAILSNFLFSRLPGTLAEGYVTIVVERLAPLVVPLGSTFTASGKVFTTTRTTAVKTDAAHVSGPDDRVLTPLSDGTYSFTVHVRAREPGSASRLSQGTLLTPVTTIPGLVKAYAAEDFSGGDDPETNAQLIQRFQTSAATRVVAGRVHLQAALRKLPQFANVLADSIIGFGDPEMQRDKRWLLPISFGGRCDWYVRTRDVPRRIVLEKTAIYMGKDAEGRAVWQLSIGRDDAPGFYDVLRVADASAPAEAGFEIQSVTRTLDLTSLPSPIVMPDLETAVEGAFSRFQAAVVRVLDARGSTEGLVEQSSARQCSVTVRAMPGIAEIQQYMASRANAPITGDLLVKAPVPCFMRVSLTIEVPTGLEDPSVADVQRAVASVINATGISGKVTVAALADAVHNVVGQGYYVRGIHLIGRLLRPDGSLHSLSSSDVLSIPFEPDRMVTSRTVALFCEPEDVSVTVLRAGDLP